MTVATEDFLSHYGVMGMKWGKRKASTGASGPSRSELRTMNKTNRKADKVASTTARDNSIDRARSMTDAQKKRTDKAFSDYKEARKAYRVEKKEIGSYAAKKKKGAAFTKFVIQSDKETANAILANSPKSGKETTNAILKEVGSIALQIAINR